MNNILSEMRKSIEENDYFAGYALLEKIRSIQDRNLKVSILNNLLVMPGHELHQEITREIQLIGDSSSIPYIRTMLESNFSFLEYTSSEHTVIAQWFSHALADINTPESINLIREFSTSSNSGIRFEMTRRLNKINS